ncbi:MAG: ABC transporter permease [Acidimicrobiales bacterium]
MLRAVLSRIGALLITLLLATFMVFLLVKLVPGDPAVTMAGEQATPEQLALIRAELGLNDPILVQYWHWLSGVLGGDLGSSIHSREGVGEAIARTFPPTLQIVVGGMLVATVIGIPAGVLSAKRANTPVDGAVSSASTAGVAMPSFWLGLVLVSVFALRYPVFPATGFRGMSSGVIESWRYTVLPAVAIGLVGAAEVTRQLRAAMIEELASDHVRTLRAKGISERSLIWRHALRNCAVPLLTILGLQVNRFLGATVVIEAVFGISGLGTLVVNATRQHDVPLVQGVVLVMVVIVVATSFLIDLSYRMVDPRISR